MQHTTFLTTVRSFSSPYLLHLPSPFILLPLPSLFVLLPSMEWGEAHVHLRVCERVCMCVSLACLLSNQNRGVVCFDHLDNGCFYQELKYLYAYILIMTVKQVIGSGHYLHVCIVGISFFAICTS